MVSNKFILLPSQQRYAGKDRFQFFVIKNTDRARLFRAFLRVAGEGLIYEPRMSEMGSKADITPRPLVPTADIRRLLYSHDGSRAGLKSH
jgi:hypothetical protein